MVQQEFLEGVTDADNHRPLLWLALQLTVNNKKPVAELGAGTGSTPFLRQYCKDTERDFWSFDSNLDWAIKWKSEWVENWHQERIYQPYSVVLIDQAPGEYRHTSMIRLKDDADIMVVHDSEPDESMGYRLGEIWHLFKYRVFTKGDKIWSAAVSNSIDLTKHVGESIGNFKIEL